MKTYPYIISWLAGVSPPPTRCEYCFEDGRFVAQVAISEDVREQRICCEKHIQPRELTRLVRDDIKARQRLEDRLYYGMEGTEQ